MEFNKSWGEMTPAEKMSYVSEAMANPCDEHDYEDSVNMIGDATMLQQVCRVCFNIQGWVYNWDTRE